MAYILITGWAIAEVFDIAKLRYSWLGVEFHGQRVPQPNDAMPQIRVDFEMPGVPEGDVQVYPDFKFHDDGSVTLLRLLAEDDEAADVLIEFNG